MRVVVVVVCIILPAALEAVAALARAPICIHFHIHCRLGEAARTARIGRATENLLAPRLHSETRFGWHLVIPKRCGGGA